MKCKKCGEWMVYEDYIGWACPNCDREKEK